MRTVVTVVLLTVCFLVSGCGDAPSGQATVHRSKGPDPALVSWVGEFCAAGDALLKMPAPIPVPDRTTESDRSRLLRFLASAHSALTEARKEFAGVRRAPAPSGNTLLAKYRKAIAGVLKSEAKYTTAARTFPGADLHSVYTLAGLDIGLFDPAGYPEPGYDGLDTYLKHHSDLAAAYHRAAACSHAGEAATPTG